MKFSTTSCVIVSALSVICWGLGPFDRLRNSSANTRTLAVIWNSDSYKQYSPCYFNAVAVRVFFDCNRTWSLIAQNITVISIFDNFMIWHAPTLTDLAKHVHYFSTHSCFINWMYDICDDMLSSDYLRYIWYLATFCFYVCCLFYLFLFHFFCFEAASVAIYDVVYADNSFQRVSVCDFRYIFSAAAVSQFY